MGSYQDWGFAWREDDNAEEFVTDVTKDETNVDAKYIVLLFNNSNVQAYACIYGSLRPTSLKQVGDNLPLQMS